MPHPLPLFFTRPLAAAAGLALATLGTVAQAGWVQVASHSFDAQGCASSLTVGSGWVESDGKGKAEKNAGDARLERVDGSCVLSLSNGANVHHDFMLDVAADAFLVSFDLRPIGPGYLGKYLDSWIGFGADYRGNYKKHELGADGWVDIDYAELTRLGTDTHSVDLGAVLQLDFQASKYDFYLDNFQLWVRSTDAAVGTPLCPVLDRCDGLPAQAAGGTTNANPVPEPASLLLVAIAGLGLLGSRLRRRRD